MRPPLPRKPDIQYAGNPGAPQTPGSPDTVTAFNGQGSMAGGSSDGFGERYQSDKAWIEEADEIKKAKERSGNYLNNPR